MEFHEDSGQTEAQEEGSEPNGKVQTSVVGDANLINHLQIPSRSLLVRYGPISLGAWFFFVFVEQQAHDSALASRLVCVVESLRGIFPS